MANNTPAVNTNTTNLNPWEIIQQEPSEPFIVIQPSDINLAKKINHLGVNTIVLKEQYYHMEDNKIQVTGQNVSPIQLDPSDLSLYISGTPNSYPGKSATFFLNKTQFRKSGKTIEFVSKTRNSLLTTIRIIKDKQSRVKIQVCFNFLDRDKVFNFFKNEKIIDSIPALGPLYLTNPLVFKKFYYLIQKNNILPSEGDSIWSSIIEPENYLKVYQQQEDVKTEGSISPSDMHDEDWTSVVV